MNKAAFPGENSKVNVEIVDANNPSIPAVPVGLKIFFEKDNYLELHEFKMGMYSFELPDDWKKQQSLHVALG